VRIQPIVEGHGEVAAVPVLLRRLLKAAAIYDIDVNPPIRRKRTEFGNEAAVRKAVRLATMQPECVAILLLFDADEDCPKDMAPRVEAWAKSEARTIPCAVVMPNHEYEAWFLAAMESLRGKRGVRDDAVSHSEPERPRDAKGALEERMNKGRCYAETADQAALTDGFDFGAAYTKSRSFRRMTRAFACLLSAAGKPPELWPPTEWQEPE
jgi:hypothetical protein